MNPRSPTETMTPSEAARLQKLAHDRGAKEATTAVGLRTEKAFFKAAMGLPVSRLTAQVIRYSLDRI